MAANRFSNVQLTEMLIIYGEADRNAAEASRLYALRFPQPHPNERTFVAVVQRCRDTGCVRGRGGGGGYIGNRRNYEEANILNNIERNPRLSVRYDWINLCKL